MKMFETQHELSLIKAGKFDYSTIATGKSKAVTDNSSTALSTNTDNAPVSSKQHNQHNKTISGFSQSISTIGQRK